MALSQQQFERLKSRLATEKEAFTASQSKLTETSKPGIMDTFKENLNKRATAVSDIVEDYSAEKQGLARSAFQFAGQGAGLFGDIIGDVISRVGSKVIPDAVKDNFKEDIANILNTPQAQEVIKKYQSLPEDTKRDVAAGGNLLSLIPAVKGTKVAAEAAEEGAKFTARTVVNAAENVTDLGKNVVNKASDVVTPIEKGVTTVLAQQKGKAAKLNKYVEQATKAIEDYSQPTPMEIAGNEAATALEKITTRLQKIGESKKKLTQGVADTKVGTIVDDARVEMRKLLEDRVGLKFGEKQVKTVGPDGKEMSRVVQSIKNAKGRASTVSDKADLRLLFDVDRKLKSLGKAPTFQKVDDAIDYIQDLLFKRSANLAVPVNGKVEGILKSVVGQLNSKLKKIGGAKYTKLNDTYSKIMEIRDILNKGLGVDGNKGASLMKQLFSPNGTMPRKLFANIKKITGIDLVEEATLAKFAMENIGDVRQASLLEQVLKGSATSKEGLIGIAAEKILNKIQDPIGKAKRIIEKTK